MLQFAYLTMVLTYNISFTIASLFISAVLILIMLLNYSKTNLVNKRFRYFLSCSVLMFALDLVTAITNDNGAHVPVALNIFLNSIYFFTGAATALLFFYYCLSIASEGISTKSMKIFFIVNISVLAAYGISLVANAFGQFYFYFNPETGKYIHGDAYFAVNLVSLAYVFESMVVFGIKRKHFDLRKGICTGVFYFVFLGSFIIQLFAFPDILLTDFGCAIGSLIVFFSLETPDYAKLMATLNELNELKASLEIQVEARTHELDLEKESYETLTLETLSSLANVIDAKDHYTNGHSFRVAAYARALAAELGLSAQECEQIYFAGLIHDVGKIGISERILTKPGKLTEEEYRAIQAHSDLGGNILKGIRQFKIFEQVARSHHERYDGTGYPDKLGGEDIPFPARIVAVCDTYDAMTSDRSYRKALSDEAAIRELIRCKGTQFDPACVDAFLDVLNRYSDSIRLHIDELSQISGSIKS